MSRLFWKMPKAMLTVFVFWYVVSLLFSGSDIVFAGQKLIYGAVLVATAFIGGWIIWLLLSNMFFRDKVFSLIGSDTSDEQEISLALYTSSNPKKSSKIPVKIPLSRRRLPRSRPVEAVLNKWQGYAEYKKQHPKYAKVFDAVFGVLSHYRYLPATQHEQGHGGASLVAHSMNVVRLMERAGHNFKYFGQYQKNRLVAPLQDPDNLKRGYYQFDKGDPILPIVALAHDLGKIVAYKTVDAPPTTKEVGNELQTVPVVRVKGYHDVLSKQLLFLIPELYDLTWKDRLDILVAVGYHHHYKKAVVVDGRVLRPLAFSNELSDRQHALAELLDYIDTQTGYLEDGQDMKPFFVPETFSSAKEKPSDLTVSTSIREEKEAEPTSFNQSDLSGRNEVSEPQLPDPDDEENDSQNDTVDGVVFQWLCNLVREESKSKRGNSRFNRYDGWVFLDEIHWRTWLIKKGLPVSEPEGLTTPNPVGVHPATKELLRILDEKKALPEEPKIEEVDQRLYQVAVERSNGGPYIRGRVIVFNESILPFNVTLKKSSKLAEVIGQAVIVGVNSSNTTPSSSQQRENRVVGDLPPNTANAPNNGSEQSKSFQPRKQEPSQKASSAQNTPNGVADALIEWVCLVQNFELPDQSPFEEVKMHGRVFAKVDVLAIPKRFIQDGMLGQDKRIIIDTETSSVLVPIERRKRI